MPGRGQGFFSVAMDHPIHWRMASLIRACSGPKPAGTRALVLSVVGDRAMELTRKQGYHLIERILASAVRQGFVDRLPVRGQSDVGRGAKHRRFAQVMYKENLYVATDAGRRFADRHHAFCSRREPERRPGNTVFDGCEDDRRRERLARREKSFRTGVPYPLR